MKKIFFIITLFLVCSLGILSIITGEEQKAPVVQTELDKPGLTQKNPAQKEAENESQVSSVPKQEEIAADLLAMETVSTVPVKEQQRIFDRFQSLIGPLLAKPHQKLELLRTLCEKQIALFPLERKAFIDFATFYFNIDNTRKMFEMADASLSKTNFFHKDPKNLLEIVAYTLRGKYFVDKKEYNNAYTSLMNARDKGSNIALTFLLLGNVCFHLKNFQNAVLYYNAAFNIDARQAQPIDFFFYGISLNKDKKLDLAEQILNLGCARYPNAEGMHLNYGYILRQEDKLIEAYLEFHMEKLLSGVEGRFYKTAEYNIRMTEQLIKLRKNQREQTILEHLSQWDALFNEKKYDAAIKEIKAAKKELGTSHWVLNLFLEQTYRKAGQTEKALAILNQMSLETPGVADTFLERCEIYLDLKDTKNAVNNIRLAYRLAPNNWRVKRFVEKIKIED